MSRLALIAACALFASCSLVLSYEGQEETGALCANGRDDDFDGAADCLDSTCDGMAVCAELSRERCRDQRDNDLDGRRDQEDLDCWPFARFEVLERCESVGPASWDGSFRGVQGGWASSTGVEVVLAPDPANDVATLEGRIEGPTLAGDFAPAAMRIAMEVAPDAAVSVGFMVAGADARSDEPDGLFLRIARGDLYASGSNESFRIGEDVVTERRWIDAALHLEPGEADAPHRYWIEIDGTRYEADGDGFGTRASGEIPSALAPGRAITPVVWVTDGSVRVGATHVELSRLDPCDYAVPQVEATIRALSGGPDGLCAIGEGEVGLAGNARAWASDDEAHSFAPVGELDAGGLFVGSSALVGGTSYEGVFVLRAPDRRQVVALHGIEGERCDALRTQDLAPPIVDAQAFSVGFAIAPLHRISVWTTISGPVPGVGLYEYRSPTGEPGSYEVSGPENAPGSFFYEAYAGGHFVHAGDDRAILLATDRGIEAFIEQGPGAWASPEDPLLTPSGRIGTFDELLVSTPALYLEAPAPLSDAPEQTGYLAFTGEQRCRVPGDESTCALPSGILRLRVLPIEP
jgi:hypothetical protein